MTKPLLLDLFCCQGGAAKGYADAGFEIVGVDKDPQPRYPYTFVQADAVEYAWENAHRFDFIHASPPCQKYTVTQVIHGNQDHPDLIDPTREALELSRRPYVIENVYGARKEMIDPEILCGQMFGLHTYRHRLFETGGGFEFDTPDHPAHTQPVVQLGRPVEHGRFYHAVGNFSGVGIVREDWKVPWMSRDGIREAIPPAYTEYIGRKFLDQRVDR